MLVVLISPLDMTCLRRALQQARVRALSTFITLLEAHVRPYVAAPSSEILLPTQRTREGMRDDL